MEQKISEIEECKFFSNPRNNHLGYCVHKQNTDFRSKGERLHKRQKAKRCSPEFCPLLKIPVGKFIKKN